MVRQLTCVAVVALLFGSAALLAADDQKNQQPLTPGTFVAKAASAGMFEIKASQLAEQRAQRPEVKRFAQEMVRDHTKAADELKAIALRKGYSLPTRLDQADQQCLDRVTNATGQSFDTTYVQEQIKAHKEAVKMFQEAARSLDDADLKAWAMKTLPTLQKHLQEVEALAKNGTGGTAPPPRP